MDNDSDDTNSEGVQLLASDAQFRLGSSESDGRSSTSGEGTLEFKVGVVKSSTVAGGLEGTWGGRRSRADSSRLRRTRSWSAEPPDDVSSEVRILRERLVRTQTRPRPSAVRHLSSRQRLTLTSLALVDFMSFCSMSVMAPFFPKEAALKGLSDTTCGLVFSFYAVVMFITSPFFGKFLPTVGAKFMFTSGMLVAGCCNVLFGTLVMIEDPAIFTPLCFVIRGLEALGASAYSTASYVFVVNAFPDSIGSVLGILETFVGLGMSVGPAIGGLLYSIGGFGLPFYTLGIIMVATVPINFFLLTDCEEYVSGSKTGSILKLFKIPSIIITGLVIVVVSNTWAFLDPTLEPHLRQFGLSAEQIGLVFLLFSSLYGIFSPIWGWVADRVHNHWCMMVWGLFLSTLGLLLLGPCPFIPGLPPDLWLDLVALSILGMSVALTLLPTFQGVLASSIYEGGCPEALATYSAVAGVWSCCYSLGEGLGPAAGGALAHNYGFPLTATICAAACFIMGVITLTFFSLRESSKSLRLLSDNLSDSLPYTDTTWNSNGFCHTRQSTQSLRLGETSPLVTPCSCYSKNGLTYGTSNVKHFCITHKNNNRSSSATFAEVIAYFLKFQYLTDMFVKLRRRRVIKRNEPQNNQELYQNYFHNNSKVIEDNRNGCAQIKANGKTESQTAPVKNGPGNYVQFLDEAIFGTSPGSSDSGLIVKRNNKGLMSKIESAVQKRPSGEILRHNLEKIVFYVQNQACVSQDDIFDSCGCRDEVTYVRGTVALSSTGACEV